MRFRRRYAILGFASVAALAVGGIASAHDANVSTLPTWNVTPNALPGSGGGGTNGGSGATAPVALDVQTHTVFAHPGVKESGGFAKTVTLLFDNDIVINLSGIPSCTATFPSTTELGGPTGAWEKCGPGADGAGEVNAYLSPPTAVSGTASTAPPANLSACVLVFKKSATQLLLFSEVNTAGAFTCADPANNTAGETSVTLTGTLSSVTTPDYKTKLTVPNVDKLALPLDDFKAKVKRASVFNARCQDTNKLLNLKGTFQYSLDPAPPPQDPQATDTVNKTKACT